PLRSSERILVNSYGQLATYTYSSSFAHSRSSHRRELEPAEQTDPPYSSARSRPSCLWPVLRHEVPEHLAKGCRISRHATLSEAVTDLVENFGHGDDSILIVVSGLPVAFEPRLGGRADDCRPTTPPPRPSPAWKNSTTNS